jgi:hypothetical protein
VPPCRTNSHLSSNISFLGATLLSSQCLQVQSTGLKICVGLNWSEPWSSPFPVAVAHICSASGNLQVPGLPGTRSIMCSAWKSSPKTGKRPRPDRTLTDQDRKISRPIKTATAVWSSVPLHLAKLKTDQNRFKPVVTGLSGPKNTGR